MSAADKFIDALSDLVFGKEERQNAELMAEIRKAQEEAGKKKREGK